MLIDTHCHLDAADFDADRDDVVARARAADVAMIVIPAIGAWNFDSVRALAHRYRFAYALGIHPLYVEQSAKDDVERLKQALQAARDDPRLVAVGEIGLDWYVEGADRERQDWFYSQQLRLARDFALPVILHVRRSADGLLKYLNRFDVQGGITHAFNGSPDQAQRLIDRGLRLGFGGAMTYDGSRRIRRFAATVPDAMWVLETDAPDIPPQWLRKDGGPLRNEPAQLARYVRTIAELRGIDADAVASQQHANACAALPRLAALLAHAPHKSNP